MISIKGVMDELFKDVKFDKKFMEKLYRYQVSFLNSPEHLRFFGSNLIGVHVVRFKLSDQDRFFNDVMGAERIEVELKVKTINTISHEFKTSSDAMNITLMYVMHRCLTSSSLSEKDRYRAAYDTALIFFYRSLIIRQSEYFHHPADPKISRAAYAKLSNKFLIKQLGSWGKVMEYRANDLLRSGEGKEEISIHYKTLLTFTNDIAIAYAISDSVNRVKELYKSYMIVFYNTHKEGDSIGVSSSTVIDTEGVEKLKDKIKKVDNAVVLLQRVIHDRSSFIRPELVAAIADINTNTSQRMINATLSWMCEHSMTPTAHKEIDEFIRLTIVHSYHLLTEANLNDSTDLGTIIVTLKNLYLSTRSTDRELIKIRNIGDSIVKKANGSVNNSLALATRTAVILYISLLTFVAGK